MRRRIAPALALVLLASLGSAQMVSHTARGAVTFGETNAVSIGALAPSVVQSEYAVGTPIEVTFSYDRAAVGSGTSYAYRYDAPFTVTGRIGARTFSANASFIEQSDAYPWGADTLAVRIDPAFSRTLDGITDTSFSETNPFFGTGFALESFTVNIRAKGDVVFGTSLPASLDLAQFDSSTFAFTYHRPAFSGLGTPETRTSIRGAVTSLTPVPEPATLAALGLGAAALLRRRRHRSGGGKTPRIGA